MWIKIANWKIYLGLESWLYAIVYWETHNYKMNAITAKNAVPNLLFKFINFKIAKSFIFYSLFYFPLSVITWPFFLSSKCELLLHQARPDMLLRRRNTKDKFIFNQGGIIIFTSCHPRFSIKYFARKSVICAHTIFRPKERDSRTYQISPERA